MEENGNTPIRKKRRMPESWIESVWKINEAFFPDADDQSLDRVPYFKTCTRVKLTVHEAIEQGIITQTGIDPRFTVIAPIRFGKPNLYMRVKSAEKYGRRYDIRYSIVDSATPDRYSPQLMQSKARLHIIVN